jgi:drug/metabolite transporter (DMT)-like permease
VQLKTAVLTVLALVAFAANSVLCRLALGRAAIDAASFSTIRLASGALTLWLIVALLKRKSAAAPGGSWISASMLFLYAVSFSFAYLSLGAGTGALILFGSVQATMIMVGLRSGERLHAAQWLGLLLAVSGLLYLVFPGLTAPSPIGSILMSVAGIAWGVYSLRGRGASDPMTATAGNFVRSVPMALAVSVMMLSKVQLFERGVLLAIISGSLTSGIGYVIWYAALRGLTATRAAMVQLSVPVLAALGGVVFLSEAISARLVIAAVVILGGVGLAVFRREPSARHPKCQSSY